ncbi:MerR family transcriptional regulator [Pseudorhodoferax sp.]|uniref:MerR family transcriptional regulator n=1 Tax=Pseudorhodoferax sp. TaxID=1993553 RepID=UPI002DD6B179|nr:MerR family transcriptional regulator [Pseudorhodoferax sp.]
MGNTLPSIPAKRYFTIGEVGDLCGVKPHVLRYWEQEFTQLRPMKRRGNRRYYQHHEVLMIRRIRDLLYDQGFTISGARNKLQEAGHGEREAHAELHEGPPEELNGNHAFAAGNGAAMGDVALDAFDHLLIGDDDADSALRLAQVRRELCEIRSLLSDFP